MKFVLVIFFMSGSYDGGVSTVKIDGFKSEQICNIAASHIPYHPVDGWVHVSRAYCLEVK